MKKIISLTLFLCSVVFTFGQAGKIIAPNDFFIEPMGSHFYPHHSVVDYFETIAEASPNVEMIQYGRTNEQRPLVLAFVSSPENIRNLEAIRLSNLKRAGLYDGEVAATDKAIVWLSYGVHGNEASSPSAAVQTLYELLRSDNAKAKQWLENTIVVMDPSVNPDGYARSVSYTHLTLPTTPYV